MHAPALEQDDHIVRLIWYSPVIERIQPDWHYIPCASDVYVHSLELVKLRFFLHIHPLERRFFVNYAGFYTQLWERRTFLWRY